MSFQIRPSGFRILPPVIKNLLIINSLILFAQFTLGQTFEEYTVRYLALHSFFSEYFMVHQLITHMFLHGNFSHLLFNMFALWMFGNILENQFGTKRFLTFYIMCGLGAAFFHLAYLTYQQYPIYEQIQNYYNTLTPSEFQMLKQSAAKVFDQPTVGASGAVFGCLAAFGYMYPNALIYLYFFFPIRAKWFVIFYMLLEVAYLLQNSAGDNIARLAHIGGAVIGFLLVYFLKKGKRLF